MPTVHEIFSRWRSIELDVREATDLMMSYINTGDMLEARAQREVVGRLRAESGRVLREYLHVMEVDSAKLSHQSRRPH